MVDDTEMDEIRWARAQKQAAHIVNVLDRLDAFQGEELNEWARRILAAKQRGGVDAVRDELKALGKHLLEERLQ